MIDFSGGDMLVVAVVALVVIGPKDLPKAMRFVGHWVGRARGMARHFRAGFDEMVRQSELEEMERRWAEENARIMREHPLPPPPEEEADDAAAARGDAPVMEPLQPALPLEGDAFPPSTTARVERSRDAAPDAAERPATSLATNGEGRSDEVPADPRLPEPRA